MYTYAQYLQRDKPSSATVPSATFQFHASAAVSLSRETNYGQPGTSSFSHLPINRRAGYFYLSIKAETAFTLRQLELGFFSTEIYLVPRGGAAAAENNKQRLNLSIKSFKMLSVVLIAFLNTVRAICSSSELFGIAETQLVSIILGMLRGSASRDLAICAHVNGNYAEEHISVPQMI